MTLKEKLARAMKNEREQWCGIRTNKGETKPFELCRHSDPKLVSPVVKKAWSSYEKAKVQCEKIIDAACADVGIAVFRAHYSDPANISDGMLQAFERAFYDEYGSGIGFHNRRTAIASAMKAAGDE